jgi:predicted nucleic acid-binding protein
MTVRSFVDTNILIYAGSGDAKDATKRNKALEILRRPDIGFSAQVLQEYYDVAYRKKRLGITHAEALYAIRQLRRKTVAPITSDLVISAAELSERFKLSYWDAAIIAAAKELDCATIYSEDLNAGQTYDGIRVINPFA